MMITIQLPRGTMKIEIEEVNGQYQRVSRYTFATGKFAGKTLTNRSKTYKTERGAVKEAEKFADQQARVMS